MRAEVAVVGAGPAGAVAAWTLARQGMEVLLLDRPRPDPWRVGESLPPAANPVLDALGLTARLRSAGHLPSYGNLSSWSSRELVASDFLFSPYGHGWHLDRDVFDRSLTETAEAAGTRRLTSDGLAHAERTDGGWEIGLRGRSEVIRARFVIDASGRGAVFASRQGIGRVSHDRLVAAAALLSPSRPGDCDSRTLIEAVAEGWWYTALLPQGLRVAVFHTDGDLVDIPALRAAEDWWARLQRTEHVRQVCEVHGYRLQGEPRLLPANSSRLTVAVGDGWVAAGDAAAAFDPLSSQGLLSALSSGRRAAQVALAEEKAEAAATYQATAMELYRQYLRSRDYFYHQERRWRDSPFWRRRHSALQPPLPEGRSRRGAGSSRRRRAPAG